MNDIFKIFFSMSLSGSLLILFLFLCKPFIRNRLSKRWQYYIWLIVIARLLLPFAPEKNLMGILFSQADQTTQQTTPVYESKDDIVILSSKDGGAEHAAPLTENGRVRDTVPESRTELRGYLWMIWLGIALLLLIRKITVYQSFAVYVKAGWEEVSDIRWLDRLSQIEELSGVRRPVELYTNSLIASPLLLGFFRPCIVLPDTDMSDIDFQYTVKHELVHYKRLDMYYKWLVQLTICLHWFNPLVWLMGQEISRACELSCDEAVIRTLDAQGRRDYGDTLFHAMGAKGNYKNSTVSLTLSESVKLLEERMRAIMNFRKSTSWITIVSVVLAAELTSGAIVAGAAVPSSGSGEQLEISEAAAGMSADRASVSTLTEEIETLDIKGRTYYLIFSEEQLRSIGSGEYGLNKDYIQQADIDLSSGEWIPIGTMEEPFTGSYNGNGYEITGLTMTDPDADIIGLFGVAENAAIYNITLRDYDIMSAGRNVYGRSIAPVLAMGLGSVRSYDNILYPKKAASSAVDRENSLAEKYYEDDNLSYFRMVIELLDENARREWLEKSYNDNKIAFFSVCLDNIDASGGLIEELAERAYEDEEISCFSLLMDYMSIYQQEAWLDRAEQDGKISYLAMLLDELDREWELDAWKAEQEKTRLAEYEAYGITVDGKTYYYLGQMVNVFLDHRSDSSFYTLDRNPHGTVNIKVIRDEDNRIKIVDYMTEEEVKEWFGDMEEPEEADDIWFDGQEITIPVEFADIKSKEYIWFGNYSLNAGDRVYYNVTAETGERMNIGFAKPGEKKPNTMYNVVSCARQNGKLEIASEIVWKSPAEPGEYSLFIYADGDALTGVDGNITIVHKAKQ